MQVNYDQIADLLVQKVLKEEEPTLVLAGVPNFHTFRNGVRARRTDILGILAMTGIEDYNALSVRQNENNTVTVSLGKKKVQPTFTILGETNDSNTTMGTTMAGTQDQKKGSDSTDTEY